MNIDVQSLGDCRIRPAITEPHLSKSQLNSIARCEAEYNFKYVDKIPQKTNYAMARGILLHEGLNAALNGESIEEAFTAYFDRNPFPTIKQKPKKIKGKDEYEPLKTFDQLIDEVGQGIKKILPIYQERKILGTERGYILRFEDPSYLPVIGYLDYLTEEHEPGTLFLNDLKTTAKKKSKNDLLLDYGMIVYAIGVLHEFKPKKIMLGYDNIVYLKKEIKIERILVPFDPLTIPRVLSQIRRASWIRALEGVYPPKLADTPYPCSSCDFIALCNERHGLSPLSSSLEESTDDE